MIPNIPSFSNPTDYVLPRCQSEHLKKLLEEAKKQKSAQTEEECASPALIPSNLRYEDSVVME